jgi:AmpE protein
MTLIAIVLVLVGLRWIDVVPSPRDTTRSYIGLLRGLIHSEFFWHWPATPWLLVIVPAALLDLLNQRLPWLLQFAVSLAVLWFTLGPRELSADVRAWLAARARGDQAEAQQRARVLWGKEHGHELGDLFVASHERLFGVLIWFFALGPAGALLYHLGRRLPGAWPGEARHARVVHAVLAYPPVLITTVLFAMAGSADDVIAQWRRQREQAGADWAERTWIWLSEIAAATLNVEEEASGGPVVPASLEEGAREFMHLEFRALLILLAFFAIFTVGSWFG